MRAVHEMLAFFKLGKERRLAFNESLIYAMCSVVCAKTIKPAANDSDRCLLRF
jgi:hypothetical protein